MRVFVKDRAVGADVAGFDILLLADAGDAAGGQTSGAGADELGEAATEFAFGFGRGEGEVFAEEVFGLGQVLVGVFFDHGEEGGVEGVRFFELGDVLAVEDEVFVFVEVDEDETEDFAEVEAGDHFFEGLLAGAGGFAVDDAVVGG